MKRSSILFSCAALGLLGLYAIVSAEPTTTAADDAKSGNVLVALTGRTSDISHPRYFLASSQEILDQRWVQHMGDRVDRAAQGWPMTPQLDFEQCEAIFVFGGERSNANGYRVLDVIDEDDAVTIRYELISYQTSSMTGQDHGDDVTPWAMFVTPRTDKTIFLEENIQGLIGGDPKWKQRIAFPGLIGVGRTVGGTSQH